jgi:hypothetical protein
MYKKDLTALIYSINLVKLFIEFYFCYSFFIKRSKAITALNPLPESSSWIDVSRWFNLFFIDSNTILEFEPELLQNRLNVKIVLLINTFLNFIIWANVALLIGVDVKFSELYKKIIEDKSIIFLVLKEELINYFVQYSIIYHLPILKSENKNIKLRR